MIGASASRFIVDWPRSFPGERERRLHFHLCGSLFTRPIMDTAHSSLTNNLFIFVSLTRKSQRSVASGGKVHAKTRATSPRGPALLPRVAYLVNVFTTAKGIHAAQRRSSGPRKPTRPARRISTARGDREASKDDAFLMTHGTTRHDTTRHDRQENSGAGGFSVWAWREGRDSSPFGNVISQTGPFRFSALSPIYKMSNASRDVSS